MSVPDASYFTKMVQSAALRRPTDIKDEKPHNTFAAVQYSGRRFQHANKRVSNNLYQPKDLDRVGLAQAKAKFTSYAADSEKIGTAEALQGLIPAGLFLGGVDQSVTPTSFSMVNIAKNALINLSRLLPLKTGEVLVFPISTTLSVDLIDGTDLSTRTTLSTDGDNTYVKGVYPNTKYTNGVLISVGGSYSVGRHTLKVYGNASSAVTDGSLYSNPARIDYEENGSSVNDQLERFERVDIVNAGHSAAELFEAGFDIKEVRVAVPPYSTEELLYSGFGVSDLRIAGLSVSDIVDAGAIVDQVPSVALYIAGFSASELRASEKLLDSDIQTAGYSIFDLRAAGYTARDLKFVLEPSVSQLRFGGYSVSDIADAEYSFNAMDFYTGGFSVSSIRDSTYFSRQYSSLAVELLIGGVSVNVIKEAIGFTRDNILVDLPTLGINVRSLIRSSEMIFTIIINVPEFISLGYVLADLVDLNPIVVTEQYPTYKSQFAAANFTLSDLVAAGFSLPYLRKSSYQASELKSLEYTAAQLRDAGYTLTALKTAQYSVSDLREAGYTVTELMREGYRSAAQLKLGGYTASDLRLVVPSFTVTALQQAGYTLLEIQSGGYTLSQLRVSGYTASEVKELGYTAQQLADAGYNALELKTAEYSIEDIFALGFGAAQLAAAGYAIEVIFNNSPVNDFIQVYSASQMADAGITTNQLVARNVTPLELKNAGYSAIQVWTAGFMNPPIRNTDLKAIGYSISDLQASGFDNNFILLAGYTTTELRNGGYTLSDLKSSGLTYTVSILRAGGYTPSELYAQGYRAIELKDGGYTFTELRGSGYGIYEIITIAGFTPDQYFILVPLYDITNYNMKQHIRDVSQARFRYPTKSAREFHIAGYSASDLKNRAFFNLTDIIKAGYTIRELLEAGFPLSDLRTFFDIQSILAEGYGVSYLLTNGYTFNDLQSVAIQKRLFVDEGYTVSQLKSFGYSVYLLSLAGYSISDLIPTYSLSEIRPDLRYRKSDFENAGYTTSQLKAAGNTALDLKNFGYTAADVYAANYTYSEAKAAGFGIFALGVAGYRDDDILLPWNPTPQTPQDLKRRYPNLSEARFMFPELSFPFFVEAGYSVFDLKNIALFNASDFYGAGLTLAQAREAGFSVSDLSGTGYSLVQPGVSVTMAVYAQNQINFNNAGYTMYEIYPIYFIRLLYDPTFTTLKQMGASASVAKFYNFTGSQVRASGYDVEEALIGGYTPLEVKNAGYGVVDLALSPRARELKLFPWINVGFDAQTLVEAGFN